MNIVAFESSTHHLSVALWCDGRLSERCATVPNAGSAQLLPWFSALLAEAGMVPAQLDGLAYGAGPGAFTGMRLSCAVVQGLALGLDLPVVGVSSLEALALQADAPRVLACIDARMNEVYYGHYSVSAGSVDTLQAPRCVAPDAVAAPAQAGWTGCGDGFRAYPDLLRAQRAAVRADLAPSAAAIARLAAPRLQRGEGGDAALAVPLYVRDKVALTTSERLARGGSR